jgi:DNA ligase-1
MKPMLAAPVIDIHQLRYPVLCSSKLDGIRAIVLNGVVLSRALKPIPNKYVQRLFGRQEFNGFDGELIVGNVTAKNVFNATSSAVMAKEGEPHVLFYVFDDILAPSSSSFSERLMSVADRLATHHLKTKFDGVKIVYHKHVSNSSQLEQFELDTLDKGYEGVMIRDPKGIYKFGRSTLKEGYLLKLKRFEDSEALVIGMNELMHNENEATLNHLGHQVRSSHKANKQGLGTMGSLICRDIKTNVEFEIGTGFTQEDRAWWWLRGYTCSDVVKYKFQAVGVKDKPRFPVYIGIRHHRDMP